MNLLFPLSYIYRLDLKLSFLSRCRLLLSLLIITAAVSPASAQNNIEAVSKSTVLVYAVDEGGRGTGFIISDDGYILTNNHVAPQNGRYGIRVNGSDTFVEARYVDSDEDMDVALLKVTDLDTIPLPISLLKTSVSQEVWAIGFPGAADAVGGGAVDATITRGVLSRSYIGKWKQNGSNLQIIQHDASVSGGNSGGPLLNQCGEVIGINTAVARNEVVVDDNGASAQVGHGIFFASNIKESVSMLRAHNVDFVTASKACASADLNRNNETLNALTESNQRLTKLIPFMVLLASISLVFSLKKPRTKVVELAVKSGLIERSKGKTKYTIKGEYKNGSRFQIDIPRHLSREGFVIGNHHEITDSTIDHSAISYRHLRVTIIDELPHIEDLNSEFGSSLDGVVLSPFQPTPCEGIHSLEIDDLMLQLNFKTVQRGT